MFQVPGIYLTQPIRAVIPAHLLSLMYPAQQWPQVELVFTHNSLSQWPTGLNFLGIY